MRRVTALAGVIYRYTNTLHSGIVHSIKYSKSCRQSLQSFDITLHMKIESVFSLCLSSQKPLRMPNMHHNSLDNLKQKSSSPCIILLTIYNPSNAPLHIHNASFISNSYPFSHPSNLRGVCSTRTTVAALCLLTSFHHSIIVSVLHPMSTHDF